MSTCFEDRSGSRDDPSYTYYWKRIQVQWSYDWKCWDAGDQYGDVIPYARRCRYGYDTQQWFYTPYGQIKNKGYPGKCVTYDYNNQKSYGYSYQYRPLYLAPCRDDWLAQKFNYIHNHWVSHYDGKCIDLYRNGGGYFHMNDCYQTNTDQIHKVDNYWFYPWYY